MPTIPGRKEARRAAGGGAEGSGREWDRVLGRPGGSWSPRILFTAPVVFGSLAGSERSVLLSPAESGQARGWGGGTAWVRTPLCPPGGEPVHVSAPRGVLGVLAVLASGLMVMRRAHGSHCTRLIPWPSSWRCCPPCRHPHPLPSPLHSRELHPGYTPGRRSAKLCSFLFLGLGCLGPLLHLGPSLCLAQHTSG